MSKLDIDDTVQVHESKTLVVAKWVSGLKELYQCL